MAPDAHWTLPRANGDGTQRMLYVFGGDGLSVDGELVATETGVLIDATLDIVLVAGDREAECMLLQGRPIGEPIARYGPFVMNTKAEIQQAFDDYQRTQFGGWPWPSDDPVHASDQERFESHVSR